MNELDTLNDINKHLILDIRKIIIDYLTPFPELPYLSELSLITEHIKTVVNGFRYYNGRYFKYDTFIYNDSAEIGYTVNKTQKIVKYWDLWYVNSYD